MSRIIFKDENLIGVNFKDKTTAENSTSYGESFLYKLKWIAKINEYLKIDRERKEKNERTLKLFKLNKGGSNV